MLFLLLKKNITKNDLILLTVLTLTIILMFNQKE